MIFLGEINASVLKRTNGPYYNLDQNICEDLTDYFKEMGIKVNAMHSDIKTTGTGPKLLSSEPAQCFDVLVGINIPS